MLSPSRIAVFRCFHRSTFEIDCRVDLDKIWTAMNFKTRQHVRRGQEAFSITTVEDPNHFVRFYRDNLRKQGRVSFLPLETFPALFSETHVRGCGELLSANRPDGKPAAMIFLVWDQGTMYCLFVDALSRYRGQQYDQSAALVGDRTGA